jgi:NADPH:quinone reductase-like Zn-dependent oxidoreductase
MVRPLAGSINHHDIWSLRGVGLSVEQLPMVLGTDAAGVDESGQRVLVYPVIIESSANQLGADGVSLLSEKYPGTFSDELWVPSFNLIPIPDSLTNEEAGCLSTAWLTAYRMLTTQGGLLNTPGLERANQGTVVLVQGAGGGVSTAAVVLAKALGATVWATSRDANKRARILEVGADQAFEPGVRLPAFADIVVETVGEATWSHSLKAVKTGGVVVVSGATSGAEPTADLRRVFRRQIRIQGSSMGTPVEMAEMMSLLAETGARPVIAATYPRGDAKKAFARVIAGEIFGKVVLVAD